MGGLQASLCTINANLIELLADNTERKKEKAVKEEAEQKNKENAEANTRQLVEAVRGIPMLLQTSGENLQHSGCNLKMVASHVEKALQVTVPTAFPLAPSSAAPAAAPSAGLASSSSSSS